MAVGGRAIPILAVAAMLMCVAGPSSGAVEVSVTLNSAGSDGVVASKGLRAWTGDEQAPYSESQAGVHCWTVAANGRPRYLYVRVDDKRLMAGETRVKILVTALDAPGYLEVSYDSYLYAWAGASVSKSGSGTWKTFEIDIPDAGFMRRCNGADFRLTSDQPLSVAAVRVELVKRIRKPDSFPRNFSLKGIPRFTPEARGFSFGGVYWGPGGLSEEVFDREMRTVKELGFGWVRQFCEWAEIEDPKGVFHWDVQDLKIKIAKKYGLKTLGGVMFCTDWAADAPDSVKGYSRTKYPPKNLQDLSDYVTAVVSHYKQDIKYWEGWNEQNDIGGFWGITPSKPDPYRQYVDWQRTFYKAAKKADPKCVVLTGGFADSPEFAKQLCRYYDKGLKGTFDVLNIHVYGPDPRQWYPQQIESVIRVMRHYGDGAKKIWITETGWPVDPKHPFRQSVERQAEWTPWLWAVAMRYTQVEKVFYFELRDRATDGLFGWYTRDFDPRPVVDAWRMFMKENGYDQVNRE